MGRLGWGYIYCREMDSEREVCRGKTSWGFDIQAPLIVILVKYSFYSFRFVSGDLGLEGEHELGLELDPLSPNCGRI